MKTTFKDLARFFFHNSLTPLRKKNPFVSGFVNGGSWQGRQGAQLQPGYTITCYYLWLAPKGPKKLTRGQLNNSFIKTMIRSNNWHVCAGSLSKYSGPAKESDQENIF